MKRLVAGLRQMGFDYIFDTDFSADLTIMEEGSEFVQRLSEEKESKLPMFTSCCPGWVRFLKSQYPDMVDQLSSAKSPQQMFGAIAKSYYAELLGVDPASIFCVSIMPCLAKKQECAYPSMNDAGAGQDVDVVLTTREVARLFRAEQILPELLPEEEFDQPLGTASGAGVIFGTTGGVMEAALRSAYFFLKGENAAADAFQAVRAEGFNANHGVQEAEFQIDDITVRTAVVSGLGNTRALMKKIERGEVHYDFVEVMACPGGCVGGGGQPIHDGEERAFERGKRLYQLDADAKIRYSHDNPDIKRLYEEYFGEPNEHKAHMLLHTDHLESMERYGTGYRNYREE